MFTTDVLDRIEREHLARCRWCRRPGEWVCALITTDPEPPAPDLFSPHFDAYDD